MVMRPRGDVAVFLEFHLLDTGHFALEEDGVAIAELIREFLRKNSSQLSATD